MGPNRNADGNAARMHEVLVGQIRCLPIRVQCLHYLFDDDDAQASMKASVDVSDQRLKARYQLHQGTVQECKKELLGVGIPASLLSFQDDGTFDMKVHHQWVKDQMQREASRRITFSPEGSKLASSSLNVNQASAFSSGQEVPSLPMEQQALNSPFPMAASSLVQGSFPQAKNSMASVSPQPQVQMTVNRQANQIPPPRSSRSPPSSASAPTAAASPAGGELSPRPEDVLLGKSSLVMAHPGNVRYGQILDSHYAAYELADKTEKTCIAEICLSQVAQNAGRFLKNVDGDRWVEISQLEARNKVANAFRDRRKKYMQRMKKHGILPPGMQR